MAFNRILFNASGLSGASNGAWFHVRPDDKAQRTVAIQITGTASVAIDGQADSADTAFQIAAPVAATGTVLVNSLPRMRVRIVSATAATVRVSVDGILIATT